MTPGHTQQQNGSENKWKVEIRRSLQQICWCLNWREHRGTLIFSRCLKGGGRGYGAYFRPLGPNCRTPLGHNCPVWQSFHPEFISVSLINIFKCSFLAIPHLKYCTVSRWNFFGVCGMKQIRFEFANPTDRNCFSSLELHTESSKLASTDEGLYSSTVLSLESSHNMIYFLKNFLKCFKKYSTRRGNWNEKYLAGNHQKYLKMMTGQVQQSSDCHHIFNLVLSCSAPPIVCNQQWVQHTNTG